ncbi:helix-turn-helix transcriptional regulator [Rhodanobacter denitrificans]|nr:helix-turn-helix transcriptional regulator [Rhodanobacter denitrificans]
MDIKSANSIRAARKAKGLTQQQVADQLGVSKQSVSDWENGRCDPEPRTAIALTSILRGLKFEHIYPARNDEQGRAAA